MPGGRPPKPTELKRRLGNPGKRALPERRDPTELAPLAAIPAAPRGLKRHGRASWRQLWSVGEPWLNPTTDAAILTRLCQAYDEREQLRAAVKKYGHVVARVLAEDDLDDGGGPTRVYEMKLNPAVPALRKLEELIIRMEGLCGFTPSDRTRLGLAQVKVQSALDEFLGG